MSIEQLREVFAAHLRAEDRLKRPEGIPTGCTDLDGFLFWGGLPKGALTLLCGALGTGSTSLWLETAQRAIAGGRWVAWVNHDVPLAPFALHHRGLDLSRFVAIEPPTDEKKLFWLLQELMSSSLFDLVGCDLGSLRLKEHQLRKLQTQARASHVALTFLASAPKPYRGSAASVFSLIVNFEKRRVLIERALHRPVPHSFPRSVTYARFTLFTRDRIGSRPHFGRPNGAQCEPNSLSEVARAEPERI